MSDLAELMQRDPMQLTDADTDEIILRLRQARAQYQLGVKSAGSSKKVAAPKATGPAIDLVALGLMPGTGGKT
jgi:hypothetical protein